MQSKLNTLSKRVLLLIIPIVLSFHGCAPSFTSWQSPSFQEHKFKKVVVIGMFKRLNTRTSFEEEIVKAFEAEGYVAVHGMSVFPPTYQPSSQEDLERILKNESFDLVLMSSVTDRTQETQYHQGTTYYGGYRGYGMYNYYNYNYGYNMYYGGYGYGWSDPGYYSTNVVDLVETKAFDISGKTKAEEANIWVGQSKITETSDMRKAARIYAKQLIIDLKKRNIIN
ncbi:hypothetical protein [Reichenbachiella sp.]|uniref:hypothetical protein n=1 Tax=Reichenbachiella sp. TaxID=2184521 RepID=UPI003BB18ABC